MAAQAKKWIRIARTEMAAGRMEQACRTLRSARATCPHNLEVALLLASCLVQNKQPHEAIQHLDAVLHHHPRLAAAHFGKANAQCTAGDFKAAVASYRRGLQLEDNAAGFANLAHAYLALHDTAAAEAAFESAVRLEPDNLPALQRLARCYLERGAPQQAEQCVQKALQRVPDKPEIHFLLGNLYADQGKHPAALAAYQEAAQLAPNAATVHFNLGHTLAALAEWSQAAEALQRAVLTQPDYLRAWIELGIARVQLDDVPAAIDAFQRGSQVDPLAWQPLICLGDLLARHQRLAEAAEAYERLVHLKPGFQSLVRLGVTYARQQRYREAAAPLREAQELEPGNAAVLTVTGIVHWYCGDLLAAESAFGQLLQIHPHRPDGYKYLVHLYRHQHHFTKAEEVLSQWTRRIPEDPVARHLASALHQENAGGTASLDYVRTEFDAFADSFDDVLQSLEYRVPQLVAAAVARQWTIARRAVVLDAGCGTGLCAPHLVGFARHLVGVDISPKMVDRAKDLRLYDALHVAELTGFLQSCEESFDLIVAADTLCYFGDLKAIVCAISNRLNDHGLVVFTVEDLADGDPSPGFQLRPHGRFQHHRKYVERILAESGLQILELQAEKLRDEGQQPVLGWLVTATTTSDPAVAASDRSTGGGDV